MKKWLIYLLGIITGVILTFAISFCVHLSNNSGIIGLELFEGSVEDMPYSQFEVFQVAESGCALARADEDFGTVVFIMPDERQLFYDDQQIVLRNGQRAQRIGTYKYTTNAGLEKTVPAIKIIDGIKSAESSETSVAEDNSGIKLFDEPGECVSRKNFEVQRVLESGDAIALEIRETFAGHAITSNLEVLILAQEGDHFYNQQLVKTPKGKCARQIGEYKYPFYGSTKVIPVIAFK